jgi:hypothetical protein
MDCSLDFKIEKNWQQIEDGAFDGLVRLRTLDIRYNSGLDANSQAYTTNSWNFCHKLAQQKIVVQGDIAFYKDLKLQSQVSISINASS